MWFGEVQVWGRKRSGMYEGERIKMENDESERVRGVWVNEGRKTKWFTGLYNGFT